MWTHESLVGRRKPTTRLNSRSCDIPGSSTTSSATAAFFGGIVHGFSILSRRLHYNERLLQPESEQFRVLSSGAPSSVLNFAIDLKP